MKLAVLASCLFSALSLLPGHVHAQALPGDRSDPGALGAEYRMHATGEFRRLLGTWMTAMRELDVDRAADHYRADAYLDLGQPEDPGSANVEEALEAWVGEYQALTASVADFEASGAISYGLVRLRVRRRDSGEETDGSMVLILRREGRNWRIRSQKLVLLPH